MIHDCLAKRIKALEGRTPREDEFTRELDAFLSCCSDFELRRIISITEKDESPTEDIDFMANLVIKYTPS
jgi:hypothetical protein